MPADGKPTVQSRRVGSELRRLREAAGVTAAQAAELLSCSQAKISRIENGIVSVRVVDLRILLDRFGDDDSEHRSYLERLARDSNKRGWWQDYGDTIPPYYADFIGLEADASYIKTWETSIVPGLLQTPDYARALMLANPAMISRDKLDNFISVRQERQARLEQGTDPRLDAVIWEAALTTTVARMVVLLTGRSRHAQGHNPPRRGRPLGGLSAVRGLREPRDGPSLAGAGHRDAILPNWHLCHY